MNIWDVIILAAVAAAVVFAVIRMRKRKGSGCHTSCSGCEGCVKRTDCPACKKDRIPL